MPNWCNNVLTIRSEDPAFIDRIEAAYEQGELLQTLRPQPDYPGYSDTQINDRLRRALAWCSTHKCVHGADYQHPTTKKYFCKHCASLLDKAELTTLRTTKELT